MPTTISGIRMLSRAAPNSGTASTDDGKARSQGELARPQAMSDSGSRVYGRPRRSSVTPSPRRGTGQCSPARSRVHLQVPRGADRVRVLADDHPYAGEVDRPAVLRIDGDDDQPVEPPPQASDVGQVVRV